MIQTLLVLALAAAGVSDAQEYKTVEVASGGSISGMARFDGKAPDPKRILITKDHDVCGKGERLIEEVSLSATAKSGLLNVVVYLEGIKEGKAWGNPSEGPLLIQQGCRFRPAVSVVRKGVGLDILNSDPVAHNIHAYELIGRTRRTLFNQSQPNRGDRFSETIKLRKSNEIKVECDVHNFMHAWMFAAENPYYSVTDAEGRFLIEDIPPGDYKVTAWHPTLGTQSKTMKVPPKGQAKAQFGFGPPGKK